MRGCLRRFERPRGPAGAVLLASLAVAATACSPQVLVAVDPTVDPCAGGASDAAGCIPPGLLDDLVGYWRFDDGIGSATARDGSGRGNNGALISLNANSAWVAGWAGTGIEFNGAGWVVVPASASIDAITDRVTVAAWVYLEGTVVNWGTAASRQIRDGIEQHYHLSLNADNRPSLFITTANVTQLLTAPDVVPPRTWVHLAGTYDGMNAKLFVNGVAKQSGSVTGSFAPDTTPLILGGNGNDATGVPTELFPGKLDEIMLYRRALLPEEISRLVAGALLSSTTPGGDAGAD